MATGAVPLSVPPEPQLDFADIQGIVLRSYRMPLLRGLVLQVNDAAGTRTFLRGLADGASRLPGIQNAMPWDAKPKFCVNAGLTAAGLRALGMPDATLQTFPPEFVEGAVARAAVVGDSGPNAPSTWIAPFPTNRLHVLILISAQSGDFLDEATRQIRDAIGGSASVTTLPDGVMPPDHRAHFGYVDGISQPRIAGVSKQKPDGSGIPDFEDPVPLVEPGAFVLGLPSQHPGFIYPMPSPDELGKNGSFAALRILAQDCAGFEKFLDDAAQSTGLDRELIAAKLCGRWRTGAPLAMSPDDPRAASVPMDQWNQFDYSDDPAGRRCPLGSHIRRNNPRATPVAGDGGERHRIMRRGLPYGPPFDPHNPNDGIERGLLGLFICGNLRDQFEFLMKEWVNDGDFAGLGSDRDAILGNQPPEGGRFRFPNVGKPPTILRGLQNFVRTRGSAYVFLPSITGLRYLASGG